ncbi:hypothetical protein [Janthinobacterium sp. B9-8]|uniref:hypothetical protein n=1 Tax=Janthinobacterium sp. B9-8 TaxID=1236179 RepID=UPI00061CDE50|nr:hypothetical protein [Janthinobacterium sp. B9-8]AMC33142.1 hypothetical protein VN23_00145 [Janthinobacterium sp. B9-8]
MSAKHKPLYSKKSSTTCYRSIRKLDAENAKIAESLIQLTETNRSRGITQRLNPIQKSGDFNPTKPHNEQAQ